MQSAKIAGGFAEGRLTLSAGMTPLSLLQMQLVDAQRERLRLTMPMKTRLVMGIGFLPSAPACRASNRLASTTCHTHTPLPSCLRHHILMCTRCCMTHCTLACTWHEIHG